MLKLLVLIGIFSFPIFTLGAVLIHYDHPALGTIAILYSILKKMTEEDKIDYTD